ncbi:unnamed protein product [Anisakis simplex]|uniref:G_PROTEIN_RECEP_F1_2 domain-containing protein n=1 Tax=Anisakis simplex TaxID=6269 RepID=A0A0M3JUU3_ANISI|nr:unnamed protein product [Anisakis simplex]
MNYSMKCWSERHQVLFGSTLEMILFTLFFPPICLLGIVGNTLNLMVLLGAEMRSRANSLLACLAFCDIVFLILMIPHSMANFNVFALNYSFRWYYLSAKMHLITFANWSSAVAIWLVVAVCVERVMGIRHPFHTRGHWSRYCMAALVVSIVVIAGILTSYNHFSHVCIVQEFCNQTQVMAKCFDVTLDTNANETALNSALNAALIVFLKQRSVMLYQSISDSSKKEVKNEQGASLFRRSIDQVLFCFATRQRTEQRIAITVVAIVTCFTITQGPSAVVLSINTFSSTRTVEALTGLNWYQLQTVTAFLVIVGKTLNFILFCLSSANFRRRLMCILRNKLKAVQKTRTSTINGTLFILL